MMILSLLLCRWVHCSLKGGGKGENDVYVCIMHFLSASVSVVLLSCSGGGAKRVCVSLTWCFAAFFALFSPSSLFRLVFCTFAKNLVQESPKLSSQFFWKTQFWENSVVLKFAERAGSLGVYKNQACYLPAYVLCFQIQRGLDVCYMLKMTVFRVSNYGQAPLFVICLLVVCLKFVIFWCRCLLHKRWLWF